MRGRKFQTLELAMKEAHFYKERKCLKDSENFMETILLVSNEWFNFEDLSNLLTDQLKEIKNLILNHFHFLLSRLFIFYVASKRFLF